jgi:hypothetical protein
MPSCGEEPFRFHGTGADSDARRMAVASRARVHKGRRTKGEAAAGG